MLARKHGQLLEEVRPASRQPVHEHDRLPVRLRRAELDRVDRRAVDGHPALVRAPVDVQPRRAPDGPWPRPRRPGSQRALDRGGTIRAQNLPLAGRPWPARGEGDRDGAPVQPGSPAPTGRRRSACSRRTSADAIAPSARGGPTDRPQELARWAASRGSRRGTSARGRCAATSPTSPAGALPRAPRRASWPLLRALFNGLREHGHIRQNPGELVSTPRRGRHLPRVLSAARPGACSTRSPRRARSSCATARCSSSPTRAG